MWVMGQECDGSHGSWVSLTDPLSALVQIEEALGTELIWIACRHHVMEIMLSNVFSGLFGPAAGPQTGLHKRFQNQ